MKKSTKDRFVTTNIRLPKKLHDRLYECIEHGKKTGDIKSMNDLVNNFLEKFVEKYERNGLTEKFEKETLNKDFNIVVFEENNVTPEFMKIFLRKKKLTQRDFARQWAEIEPNTLRYFLKKEKSTRYTIKMIFLGVKRYLSFESEARAEPLKRNVRR